MLGYMSFYIILTGLRWQGLQLEHSADDVLLTDAAILLVTILAAWILVIVQDVLNAIWLATQPELPLRTRLSLSEIIFLTVGSIFSIALACAPLNVD